MGRAGFNAGRAAVAMQAEIALQRLYLLRRRYHLHRAKRTGDHATFAADTAALLNQDRTIAATNRAVGAHSGARRVFTMMAGNGG